VPHPVLFGIEKAQPVENVASSYDARGFLLYFMRARQPAVAAERRPNSLYSDATARDPDCPENGASHASLS